MRTNKTTTTGNKNSLHLKFLEYKETKLLGKKH